MDGTGLRSRPVCCSEVPLDADVAERRRSVLHRRGTLRRRTRVRYPLRRPRGRDGGRTPGPGPAAARSRVRRRSLEGVLAPAHRRCATAVGSRRWRGPFRPRSWRTRVAESNTDDSPSDQLGPEPSDEVLRSLMWAVTDALARDLVTPATPTARTTGDQSERRRRLAARSRFTRRRPRRVRRGRVRATGRDGLPCGTPRGARRPKRYGPAFGSSLPPEEGEERDARHGERAPSTRETKEGPLTGFGAELARRFRPPGGRRPQPGGLRGGRLVRRARADRHRAPCRAPRRAPSARTGSGCPTRPCARKRTVLGDSVRLHDRRCGHPDVSSRRCAALLEEAGFGVLAPPWWRSSRTRLGLRLKARTSSKGGTSTGTIGLDGLCDIRWEAVLGDDTLGRDRAPPAGPTEAAARACPRPMGGAASRRDSPPPSPRSGSGAPPATSCRPERSCDPALGFEPGPGDLPVVDVAADGWLGDLLSGAEDRTLEPTPTPDGFAGELRPYQERGLAWLDLSGRARSRGLSGRRHGTGQDGPAPGAAGRRAGPSRPRSDRPQRSGTSGRLAERRDARLGPTLVLCPMSLVGNWQREAARFAPKLTVYVHHGPDRLTGKAFTRARGPGGPGPVDLRPRDA